MADNSSGVFSRFRPTPKSVRLRRRPILRVIVITQLALALVTGIAVTVAYGSLNGNIAPGEAIEHMTTREDTGPEQALNILVMGSDTRAGEGNGIDGESQEGERSDTTILLHLSADRETAYGVSIPRDALVDRPDCRVKGETIPGEEGAQFNTAFSVGGAQCTVQTVEAITDVYIDHFITLDFAGFKDMVNAINGVEVCIPEDVADPKTDIYFEAGTQVLYDEDALNYVRERSVLSVTGDIGRMKRQQAFLASMANKVASAGTLSRPDRVYSFLNAVTDSIEVDENLDSVRALFDLSMEFRGTGLSQISFVSVPTVESTEEFGRLEWTKQADALFARVRRDQPLGRMFGGESLSANDPVGSAGDDAGGAGGSGGGSTSGGGAGGGLTDEERSEREAAGLCT